MSDWDDLKGMSAPARRALANAGHETFKDLAKLTEAALAELHGMGPKAITTLRDALKEKGLTFKK
ncbi:MAG TPA: helix-hairpin-helix domain-containing protein [Acidimicrobiales bacterium]|jgi:DNA-directed RNA polymerase alpha subunit